MYYYYLQILITVVFKLFNFHLEEVFSSTYKRIVF